MIQRPATLLLPAVGYIRMSTDDQAASPARQKMEINAFAEREGYVVTQWYEDHGLTGTESAKRQSFQRLLVDAKAGTFNALILSEISRATREEPIEAMIHWRLLKHAGVKLLSVQKGGEYRLDDMGGLITLLVDQFGAHDEARKIANRTVTGKRRRLKEGTSSLSPMFGFDRQITDAAGKAIKTVSFREEFQLPRGWNSKRVVTSETKSVEAIRWAYTQLAEGKASISAIRDEWNRRAILTANGKPWRGNLVRRLLVNPSMMGCATLGHREPRAKFETVVPVGEVAIVPHEPIVDRQLFEMANRMIQAKCVAIKHGPFPYLLRRKIKCGHCGKVMHCKTAASLKKKPARSYQCFHAEYNPNCKVRTYLPADYIEQTVIRLLKDEIVSEANLAELSRDVDPVLLVDPVESKIKQLNLKIDKAGENLALANSATEFKLISTNISEWEKERDRLTRRRQKPVPAKQVISIEQLRILRDNFDKADVDAMAVAIDQIVEQITVYQTRLKRQGMSFYSGTIRFVEGVSSRHQTIDLVDSDLCYQTAWKKLLAMLKRLNRPVTRKEIGETLGVDPDLPIGSMRKVGMLHSEKVGPQMLYSLNSEFSFGA